QKAVRDTRGASSWPDCTLSCVVGGRSPESSTPPGLQTDGSATTTGRWRMKSSARQRPLVTATLIAVSCLALVGFGGGRDDDRDAQGRARDRDPPLTVPKARCGPHDNPETGLQGQVPAALRASGFKGFNCNLELIAQNRGDGANWQTTQFRERE